MKGVHACFINIPSKTRRCAGANTRAYGWICRAERRRRRRHARRGERTKRPFDESVGINRSRGTSSRSSRNGSRRATSKIARFPLDAPEFAPRVLIRALPDRPHSQDTETFERSSTEKHSRLVNAKSTPALLRCVVSEGFGVVWTSDLVDHEKLEASRKFFSCQPSEQNAKAIPLECNSKVADLLSEMAEINQDALREVYKAKQYAARGERVAFFEFRSAINRSS